jgi:hydrogenase-4 component B
MNNASEVIGTVSLFLFAAGALLPYLFYRKRQLSLLIGCLAAASGSLMVMYLGFRGLLAPEPIYIRFGNILPGICLELLIDRLSGFFLLTISVIALLTSLYSIQYMSLYSRENLAWWSFCYNSFLLAMVLVVTVNNFLLFLIFWELMTLASYFLVTYSYKRKLVRKAGFVYLIMTHIGTVFIASAFFLMLGVGGGWDFAALASNSTGLLPVVKNLVFICALIGFGTKAGVVPLHIWLPQAHPAAPTNVSALMSGVMLKTAIYGMIRMIIDILGVGPAWWGGLLILLGAISAVSGVIYALMQEDLKRLLAFCSVENIGIILMGLGASLVFYSWSLPVPAAIALAAGLFHVLNHAIFKSLLFLCTGSIYYATHTKKIEQLGGLIKRMPFTAVLFLTGAISISAIPPFNGFASEYQTYLSLLTISYQQTSVLWSLGAILACVTLALTGALAAACFVKAFGISFLALPRSEKAEKAEEVPWSMTLSIAPLAILCLVLGIRPAPLINTLTKVSAQLIDGPEVPPLQVFNSNLALVLGLLILIFIGVTRLFGGYRERKTETWGCGIEHNVKMAYTAESYSQPIRRVYQPLLRPKRKVRTEFSERSYFNYRVYFKEHLGSNLREYLYKPIRKGIINISQKWQVIQSGNINWYLGYIFLTLILLLIFVTKG